MEFEIEEESSAITPKIERIKQKYTPLLENYNAPRGKISMNEVETLLLERLLVLLCVERINESSSMTIEEKIEKLLDVVQHHKLHLYSYLLTNHGHPPETNQHLEYLEQEKVAHVFLNAIFYTWEEAAERITRQEITLFEWQTFNYKTPQVVEFMFANNSTFPEATREEKKNLRYKLETFQDEDDLRTLEGTTIYKVPWEQAINLGGSRKIAHHLGVCYVPEEKMIKILSTLYEKHLKNERSHNIYETAAIHGLRDFRMHQLQGFLFYIYSLKIREFRKAHISMSTIDNSINSFPPCARIIHEELNRKYHLKFNTRRQYWLFLKGIGAEATDVIDYTRHYFVEQGRMSDQAFKEHRYFILLLFGLVGSHIDYPTPDCAYNLEEFKGAGDVNGCPFGDPGQVDLEDLDKIFRKWKISETNRQQIFEHRRNRDCSKACSAYFEAVHEKSPTIEITHPLDFFTESQQIIKNRLHAIPEIDNIQSASPAHLDGQLKIPFPQYPDVFSRSLKAQIRDTMSALLKTARLKVKKDEPVMERRKTLIKQVPSSSGQTPSILKAKSSTPQAECINARGALISQARAILQSQRSATEEPVAKHIKLSLGSKAPITRERLIEQYGFVSNSELSAAGLGLIEKAWLTSPSTLPAAPETLLDKTLLALKKDIKNRPKTQDTTPQSTVNPAEDNKSEDKREKQTGSSTDTSKKDRRSKKNKKVEIFVRTNEDDMDPQMEVLADRIFKIYRKNFALIHPPNDSAI